MDYTVHGILKARILEWVAFPFSRESSQPRDWTQVSHIAGVFFTSWAIRELPYDPTILLLGIYLKNMKILIWKNIGTPSIHGVAKSWTRLSDWTELIFIAALCTIAKRWKQHKCPLTEGWIKVMRYIHTMEYYSAKKNVVICDNMDGPWGYYAKWNKSEGKRPILYDFNYMWNLNKTKQKQTHRYREQLDYQRGKGLGVGERDEGSQLYGDG